MRDHDATLYSYGPKNYECNIHLGRGLKELVQNISNIVWSRKMIELFFRMNNTRKIAISYWLKGIDLKLSKKTKKISSNYYKTKVEVQEEWNKAYTEYLNANMPFKDTNYLDYWLDN